MMQFIQPDTVIPEPYNPQSWNRYSYTLNNPIRYNDPSGHVAACDKDDWACQYHWDEPITDDSDEYEVKLTKKQKRVVEFLLDSSEFVVSAAVEPIDWILTIDYCTKGECSPWMLLGLLPLIPSSVGSHADDIADIGKAVDRAADAGEGFDSFRQLKKFLGDAGDDMDWHHIVEQSQIKKSGFSSQQIHNVDNVLAVDKATHHKVSGYYSSVQVFSKPLRVRDWLAGQSFGDQYDFGLKILRDFGVIK